MTPVSSGSFPGTQGTRDLDIHDPANLLHLALGNDPRITLKPKLFRTVKRELQVAQL